MELSYRSKQLIGGFMKKLGMIALLFLSGCAGTGKVYDRQAIPAPSKNMVQLIIYRPSSLSGVLESPTVNVGGQNTCDISVGSYFITTTVAGKTKIVASQYGGLVKSSLSATLSSGKRYYVKIAPNLAKSIAGGFGVLGTLAHDTVAEDKGVYQVRLIDKDTAEEEIIGTKQSTSCGQ